ncbi:Inactive serine protease 35 Precursor [Channa argus]|uniref:Inactive serine protease 35 n=1 Tax=Channa argus TaxID=215402 RepID=A0A6G1QKA8_CHAAH|nr:Inactive serine protease 35 Precursor [Channa argus]
MSERTKSGWDVFECLQMGLKHILCLLLSATALTVFGKDGDNVAYRWTRQSLPLMLDTHTQLLNTPLFRAQAEGEEKEGLKSLCGIECQSSLLPIDQTEQERILGYETMYENGTRTHTDIMLQGFNKSSTGIPANVATNTRRKRQVYGADGRFVISDSHFITNYPFSAAVRLSTNCSGVLIAPKHVLTAARCIHSGRDYLVSARKLKVGVLKLKTKKIKGGRKRGGRQRGGRKEEAEAAKEKGEEQLMEDGEEHNSIDGDVVGGRNRGKSRRRGRREKSHVVAEHGSKDEFEGRRNGKRKSLHRVRRSIEPRKQPVFRWTRVKQIRIPQGWIHTDHTANSVSSDYDYALLELKRPIKQKYMKLGVAPFTAPLARIHFSGFDSDKGLPGRAGRREGGL